MDQLQFIRIALDGRLVTARELARRTTQAGNRVHDTTILRGVCGQTNIGYHTVRAIHHSLTQWLDEAPERWVRMQELVEASAGNSPE